MPTFPITQRPPRNTHLTRLALAGVVDAPGTMIPPVPPSVEFVNFTRGADLALPRRVTDVAWRQIGHGHWRPVTNAQSPIRRPPVQTDPVSTSLTSNGSLQTVGLDTVLGIPGAANLHDRCLAQSQCLALERVLARLKGKGWSPPTYDCRRKNAQAAPNPSSYCSNLAICYAEPDRRAKHKSSSAWSARGAERGG
jgi:hypothetical protein